MEEELAANTVEYAVDNAWYVSMVQKVVCKNIRMRGRCVPGNLVFPSVVQSRTVIPTYDYLSLLYKSKSYLP